MSDIKVKRGRPTQYSAVLAQEICNVIASSSKGTKILCSEHSHWPCQDTLFTWLKSYPEFSEQYAQAKICQIELLIDEILEIADDVSNDCFLNNEGKLVSNNSSINRARLKIDTRKWLASKLVPKVYGSKVEEHTQQEDELLSLRESIFDLENKYTKEY